ncbi:VOC family protein [Rummeliibacillus pycnus]|uniref:VOC family protein n=1 Tax=Rummeliibacillus pycnus TaxID=101070 RepID=UPI003D2818F3
MVQLQFDHLVHFLDKPEDFIAELKEQNIHAVDGGVHEGRGTYNALSYFDLSYLEFLGTYDRDLVKNAKQAHHSMMETIIDADFREGFIRFASRTTDIEVVAKEWREKGLTVSGPHPLYRKRPDGSVISWRLLFGGEENDSLKLPFIIQWDDDDEKRRIEQIEQGVIGHQQLGIEFAGPTFAVKDSVETAKKWALYLDLVSKASYEDKELNAHVEVLALHGGDLHFASPNGDGIVQSILDEHGEVPFQANFVGASEDKTVELHNGRYHFKK